MKNKAKELTAYKIKLFRDAASFVKPDRVPHYANVVTWKVFDAGKTLPEAFGSFDVMKECVEQFLMKYHVDALIDVGIRNQFNVTDSFDKQHSFYYYTDEAVGISDHAYCTADTLLDYLNNKEKYIWEVALPAKYPDFHEKPLSVWQKAFDEYVKYIGFILKINGVTKKYSIPSAAPNNPMNKTVEFGIEILESSVLGIKELSIALRRNPELIKQFVDRWDEEAIIPLINDISGGKTGPNMKYCFDSSIVMLSHNILNLKQFENYYWCHFKPLLMAYAQQKKNVRLFAEGSIGRFADYFNDIPRGAVCMHIENDDIFALRKAMPNIALMGGLTSRMLSTAQPEECVEHTKRLVDELGREGGFILSEDKMLSYRNDAKSENFKAVCDFASGYYI